MIKRDRSWIFRRLKEEIARPTTKARRRLVPIFSAAVYALELVIRIAFMPIGLLLRAQNTLYVIFDLSVNAITYDFTWALVAAELERKAKGLRSIHVVFILPGDWKGSFESEEYNSLVDTKQRRWRFYNIILPMCQLLPSIGGMSIFAAPVAARTLMLFAGWHVYPRRSPSLLAKNLNPRLDVFSAAASGIDAHCLAAPDQAVRFVDQWLAQNQRGRKVIVITMRQSAYEPARNSNLDSWAAFARGLDHNRYFVVIVPDTDVALSFDMHPFEGAGLLREAAFDIRLRMALYERAWLNMGVNTGPVALCYFGLARFVQVKKIVENVEQASAEILVSHGFSPGEDPPFLGPNQHIDWDADDSVAELERVFAEMEKRILSKTDSSA